jgi:hypothetical protein
MDGWRLEGRTSDCEFGVGTTACLAVNCLSEAFARDSLAVGSWRFLDWTDGGWGL